MSVRMLRAAAAQDLAERMWALADLLEVGTRPVDYRRRASELRAELRAARYQREGARQ